MQLTKTYKNLLIAMAVAFAMGLFFELIFNTSPARSINSNHFQNIINKLEKDADKLTNRINYLIQNNDFNQLKKISQVNDGISVYVQKFGDLIYWTDNHIDIDLNNNLPSAGYELKQYSNAYCLEKRVVNDSTQIITLIFLKHNFPYENDVLRNEFAHTFNIDEGIKIVTGNKNDKHAIFNTQRNYLFTLTEPENPVFDHQTGILSFICFVIALGCFFIVMANCYRFGSKKWITLKQFLLIIIITGLFIGLSLWFKIPGMLYWDYFSSAQQYAFNPFLSSITHLSIVIFFFTTAAFLYYFGVKFQDRISKVTEIALQLLSMFYFLLLFEVIRSLVFHSGIQLNIINFTEITFIAIWLHFLILLAGIGFGLTFFKIHNYYFQQKNIRNAYIFDAILIILVFVISSLISPSEKLQITLWFGFMLLVFNISYLFKNLKTFYWLLPLWMIVFTCFFIYSSVSMNNNKKAEKYKLLAENIMINGNVETDRLTEIMLEELNVQLRNDKRIGKMASHPDSVLNVNHYLNKNYLRGYWNKYEIRLNIAPYNSEIYLQFTQLMNNEGEKLGETNFYKLPASKSGMTFLGVFEGENSNNQRIFYFLQFFPRRNFASYSFPGFLLSPIQDMPGKQDITITKYEDSKLIYSSGDSQITLNEKTLHETDKDFTIKNLNGINYYIYSQKKTNYVVITENQKVQLSGYLLYFVYLFLFYYAIAWLLTRLYLLIFKKKKRVIGFTTRFQYAFIVLLIVSFVGIFYVSVNFIEQNYKNEQVSKIENKKKYIQKALQNLYYWSQNLSEVNTQTLNLDLQELSYIYQTDIHVFNNEGELVGSSQPLIFNKNLIGTRISPVPYLSDNPDLTHYEFIGRLKYLVSYTDFYNGDFLQTGFIALPQFLSQEEIKQQISGFLSVIIHIYLIVIFLVIFLSLIIGKQLSAPLIMIENKLKLMRFGHRNEKIDYQANDEIGQLVEQYNRTIDELENSARQLAKSERESAWKTMARQIAHEINNPLTPMKLTIQQLQRTFDIKADNFEDYFKKSTKVLIEQIDNLSRIAATFSNFARLPEAQFRRVDVAERLSSVVQLFAHNHEQIEVNYFGLNEGLFVFADPEQLTQVFNNLLKNAIQAIPTNKNGKVDVTIKKTNQQISIEIADNGTGINPDIAEKLFTPNFTTKSTGMGLGLTISKNIIEITGGNISFASNNQNGTTFTINLPSED